MSASLLLSGVAASFGAQPLFAGLDLTLAPGDVTALVGPNGSLYGTASEGGAFDYGTVFKMTPSSGGSYALSVLRTFRNVANGVYPYAGVIRGPQGSIYGTTYEGGYTGGSGACGFNDTGCGVVFQLPPK